MPRCSWADLPDAAVALVAAKLNTADWRHVRETCKAWNAAIDVTRAIVRLEDDGDWFGARVSRTVQRDTWKLREAHIDTGSRHPFFPMYSVYEYQGYYLRSLRVSHTRTIEANDTLDLNFLAACPNLHTLELECRSTMAPLIARWRLDRPIINLKTLILRGYALSIDFHNMPALERLECTESWGHFRGPINAPNLHTFAYHDRSIEYEDSEERVPFFATHSIKRLAMWADRLEFLSPSVPAGVTHLCLFIGAHDVEPSELTRLISPFTSLECVVVKVRGSGRVLHSHLDQIVHHLVVGMPSTTRLAMALTCSIDDLYAPIL